MSGWGGWNVAPYYPGPPPGPVAPHPHACDPRPSYVAPYMAVGQTPAAEEGPTLGLVGVAIVAGLSGAVGFALGIFAGRML